MVLVVVVADMGAARGECEETTPDRVSCGYESVLKLDMMEPVEDSVEVSGVTRVVFLDESETASDRDADDALRGRESIVAV